MRRETCARTVPERIAGGQHGGGSSAAGEHGRDVEWHRPWLAACTDIGQFQMPFTAEHDLGLRKRVSTCFRQPGKAIFADADNGQPRGS